MNVWTDPFEAAQQLRVVVPRQVRVEAVHQVNLGQRLMPALTQLVPGLLERHRVRAGVARFQARKRTEQTTGDTDIRRFEPDVEVVEGSAAVALLAFTIGEPADREKVGTLEQTHALILREPDA